MQGEILSVLLEPQPEVIGQLASQDPPRFDILFVAHPRAIILTPDCDLLADFSARNTILSTDPTNDRKLQSNILQHIQCCDLYEEEEIRQTHPLPSDLWKRVRQNQDERYHRIPPAAKDAEDALSIPALFLDFKQMFSVPTAYLYQSLKAGDVTRQGVMPPIWVHQLMQRYFAFHSRVGVPDPNDERR
jgi:hypothetical protein